MNRIEIENESVFVQQFPLIHELILKEATTRLIELKERLC